MPVYLVLKKHYGAGSLAVRLIPQDKGIGDLTHMHPVNHLGHIGRQLLHLKLGYAGDRRIRTVSHKSFVVSGVLVFRKSRDIEFKRMVSAPDIIGYGIKAFQTLVYAFHRNTGLTQYMTHTDTVSKAFHELENMEAVFSLHNLGYSGGIGHIESYGREFGNHLSAAEETYITTLTGRSRIFGIHPGQSGE